MSLNNDVREQATTHGSVRFPAVVALLGVGDIVAAQSDPRISEKV